MKLFQRISKSVFRLFVSALIATRFTALVARVLTPTAHKLPSASPKHIQQRTTRSPLRTITNPLIGLFGFALLLIGTESVFAQECLGIPTAANSVSKSAGFESHSVENSSGVCTAPTMVDFNDTEGSVELTSHTNGEMLAGGAVEFEWEDQLPNKASDFVLYVGLNESWPNDLYNSRYLGTDTSVVANGLPTDGSSVIYVRLWWFVETRWFFRNYEFIAGTNETMISITSPAAGSPISTGEVMLTWDDTHSSTNYWVYAGDRYGGSQYLDSGLLDKGLDEYLMTNLPSGSDLVYVRLWYRLSVAVPWAFVDTVLGAKPEITGPVGSVQSPFDTFTWQDPGATVTNWWLYLGSSKGARDYEDSGDLASALTYTSTNGNLPDEGSVHARLWYITPTDNGNGPRWRFIDKEFTATPAQ